MMYKVLFQREVFTDAAHTVTITSDCVACLRETIIDLPLKFHVYAIYRFDENITRRGDMVNIQRDREIRQGRNPVGTRK